MWRVEGQRPTKGGHMFFFFLYHCIPCKIFQSAGNNSPLKIFAHREPIHKKVTTIYSLLRENAGPDYENELGM